ncbi:MAG: type III-B CRISPR module RAMP protein Cmr4 [Puniceicoccaceae bacterium]
MQTSILYLFTRTPLHLGAGSSVGTVDKPVQRERHTGFPIIPGSSIKGVVRDFFQVKDSQSKAFGWAAAQGESGQAGAISFSEAKLLLFPVRSARGAFALTTSPLALGRFKRDAKIHLDLPAVPSPGECLSGGSVSIKKTNTTGCILEEFVFKSTGNFPKDWASIITKVLDDDILNSAADRLVYLSDEDFAYLAQNACQVMQHNCIDPETGTVKNKLLFNEEVVPSETLFYSSIQYPQNNESSTNETIESLKTEKLLQFGGKETTGLGFTTVKLQPESNSDAKS